MKEISEYKLLDAETVEKLNRLVNDHIRDGWKIYGNPFTRIQSGYGSVAQAVVKYK